MYANIHFSSNYICRRLINLSTIKIHLKLSKKINSTHILTRGPHSICLYLLVGRNICIYEKPRFDDSHTFIYIYISIQTKPTQQHNDANTHSNWNIHTYTYTSMKTAYTCVRAFLYSGHFLGRSPRRKRPVYTAHLGFHRQMNTLGPTKNKLYLMTFEGGNKFTGKNRFFYRAARDQ